MARRLIEQLHHGRRLADRRRAAHWLIATGLDGNFILADSGGTMAW
jgi:hypothetical protein